MISLLRKTMVSPSIIFVPLWNFKMQGCFFSCMVVHELEIIAAGAESEIFIKNVFRASYANKCLFIVLITPYSYIIY